VLILLSAKKSTLPVAAARKALNSRCQVWAIGEEKHFTCRRQQVC